MQIFVVRSEFTPGTKIQGKRRRTLSVLSIVVVVVVVVLTLTL